MDEVKECFNHLWDKAAHQCKLLKDAIQEHYPFLIITPGYGALDAQEHKSEGKKSGEPDLFIWYGQQLICAIEVTGSDKVSNPSDIWIGQHKINFALKAEYPIGFFFFYGKHNELRLFSSIEDLRTVLDPPEIKTIRGLNFEYHVLDSSYFRQENALWDWLSWMIEERTGVILH